MAMDLPSARELELEVLLRERESQLAELSVSEIGVGPVHPYVRRGLTNSFLLRSNRMRSRLSGHTYPSNLALQPQNPSLFLQRLSRSFCPT